MNLAELQQYGNDNGTEISDHMCDQLNQYMELLIEWNQKFNLTAVTDPEEIIARHFCDCIIPLCTFDVQGCAADVGSGAGFPGLVWKIVRPDLEMTLIEPTGKRCTFLKEVIRQLQLQDIQVVNERSEDHAKNHRESYDTVTARAVANLRVLSELCLPLVKKGGSFIAMKGSRGNEELQEAAHALKVLGGEAEEIRNSDSGINLLIRKRVHTPLQYPRSYGQIKKKPL